MLHFFDQIINGSIKPLLIDYSDIEKVQSVFYSDKGGFILSDEAIQICVKKYGTLKLKVDTEHKKITFTPSCTNDLEELIDMRFPPAPDSKAKTYQGLIELEFEKIKLSVDDAIENSNRIDDIDFFTKKNIQKLKTLSKQLSEYIKKLGGLHGNTYITDPNHFILFVLKHYLIDSIQYIQEATSAYTNIVPDNTDKLLANLFNETPVNFPLTILSLLPKEKAFNSFKRKFIKSNKEHLKQDHINKQCLSIGKALFDFYKLKNKCLPKEEQLNNYHSAIYYWDELLITRDLKVVEYGKIINEPEIELILLPLLKKEIEFIELSSETYISGDAITDNNIDQKPEPHQPELKPVLNVDELVEYINISKSTIHKFTSAGTIPHYKRGKFLQFDRKEIDKWLLEKKGFSIDDLDKEALRSLNIKRK